jgi:hypothetical protein
MEGSHAQTIDAYGKWQENYAQQHWLDVNTLRQEVSQYGALYGNRAASGAYLSQHRDLAAHNTAKRVQFDQSPQGLMMGRFYNSSTVATYMRARHLTAETVEQEAAVRSPWLELPAGVVEANASETPDTSGPPDWNDEYFRAALICGLLAAGLPFSAKRVNRLSPALRAHRGAARP